MSQNGLVHGRMVAMLLLAVLLVVGCGQGPKSVKPPGKPPDLTGTIAQIQQGDRLRLLIETNRRMANGELEQMWVTVDGASKVAEGRPDGKAVLIDRNTLKVGATVAIWLSGPVLDSYPAQGYASFVLIPEG